MEISTHEIPNTNTRPMSNQQPADIQYIPSEDLKAFKKFVKDSRGVKRKLKLYYQVTSKTTFTKMDDEYAKYSGYRNRADMLSASGQLDNSGHILIHDSATDRIYVLLKVPHNSQILN